MIRKFLILFFVLINGTSQSSLEELEEAILFTHRDNYEKIPAKKFLKDIQLMSDFAFILLWYSYGCHKNLSPSRATGLNFINKVSKKKNRGEIIFGEMRANYEKFLGEKVLKELLLPDSKVSKAKKEELLNDAIALYQGKFRSIWMRIVKPGSEKFDDLRQMFSLFQMAIEIGIYESLDFVFREIFRNFNVLDKQKLVYVYKKQFYALSALLSNNLDENWGLRWVANHHNPYFIITYFYYQRYLPDIGYTFLKCFLKYADNRKRDFQTIIEILNYKFYLGDQKLKFYPDFKNPFPHIIGDDELKAIIDKIVSKARILCLK
jgi:hypothetical protein